MMNSQVWLKADRADETLWRVYCAGETEKERERVATAQDSKARVWMHRQQAQSAAQATRLERDMSARDKARANRAEKQVPLISIKASTRMPAQLPRLLVARRVCAASGVRETRVRTDACGHRRVWAHSGVDETRTRTPEDTDASGVRVHAVMACMNASAPDDARDAA